MYSLDAVADRLKNYGYSTLSSDGKTEDDRKIFFKKNILIEVYFENMYLGTRINELYLIDNNYEVEFDKLSQHFIMTTNEWQSFYRCIGVSFEKFMEIAAAPIEHIHMLVENYKTEKALEVL